MLMGWIKHDHTALYLGADDVLGPHSAAFGNYQSQVVPEDAGDVIFMREDLRFRPQY